MGTVPENIKARLQANAARTLRDYERAHDERGLRSELQSLGTPSPDAAAAFDGFVRAVYGQFIPNADQYSALASMNPQLRDALKKLYVVRIAAWRLNVQNYGHMTPVEADGVTKIDEFPLPSTRAIASYKKLASEAVGEIRAAQSLPLSDAEKAVAVRALDHARTHAAGSSGFRYGSEDLLTVWGRGGWAYDLVFLRTDPGGKFIQDDAKYAEVLNAYYDVPLARLDVGTHFALPFMTDMLVDPAFLEGELGSGPDKNPAAKAFLLLTRWWLERAAAHEDAKSECTVYSNRDAMWEGFTADNLFNADGAKSLAAFKADSDSEFARLSAQYKSLLVDAVESFGKEKGLPEAVIASVEGAVENETRYGAIVDAAAGALDAHAAGLGAELKAKLADIPKVGGYAAGETVRPADVETMKRVWADVKSYLATTYGHDVAALPADVALNPGSNATVTGQDGKITAGLKSQRTEDYWYQVLLHEAHHSYNHANGVFVEGPGWEGAAKTTETLVFPALMKKALEGRNLGHKTPYYLATNFASRNGYAAKTEATLDVLLRDNCSGANTLEHARDVARRWGLSDPSLVDDVAIRAHHGTSYLQYVAGDIIYSAFVKKMSEAVGRPVDPFQIQGCGLTFAPDDAATVAALRACLAK